MWRYDLMMDLFPFILIIATASLIFVSTNMQHYLVANPPFNPKGGFDLNYGVVDPIMKRNSREWYKAEIQNNPLPYSYAHPDELPAIPMTGDLFKIS